MSDIVTDFWHNAARGYANAALNAYVAPVMDRNTRANEMAHNRAMLRVCSNAATFSAQVPPVMLGPSVYATGEVVL